jgi:hypothetical protein
MEMQIMFFSMPASPQVKLNNLHSINNISSSYLSLDVMTKNQVRKMIYPIERLLGNEERTVCRQHSEDETESARIVKIMRVFGLYDN